MPSRHVDDTTRMLPTTSRAYPAACECGVVSSGCDGCSDRATLYSQSRSRPREKMVAARA
ncbi:hypothetical protein Trco_004828 [Trichoderma cornu-damae]|uniref:Uncharacterized protein n=1 Tax=Trichoderma cornu-damae TaxID=654480 RepID=A0A9P8QGG8_9HYPO|nr:hypothetical protein Trco_004828 [Trichoderma cornu-damae]